MGRLIILCLATGFSLDLCDDPSGPQPDKPIRPPAGYTAEPPEAPGPPTPRYNGPSADAGSGPTHAPPPTTAPPEEAKCPKDASGLVVAKVRPAPKDKKKRLELKLTGKSGGATLLFKKVKTVEDGTVDDVKAEGGELTALVGPTKGKAKLTVIVQCSWEDRMMDVQVDAKGATVKEIPPPPEPGYLSLSTEPGLKVSEGGKELGVTPIRSVTLSPGKHQLTLKGAKGKARTLSVEIKPGETTNIVEKNEQKKKK